MCKIITISAENSWNEILQPVSTIEKPREKTRAEV